jgi:uncharacterized membrane protein YfcA
VSRPRPTTRVLVGIGLAAGFFSALFGVGGGIVVVPLLILLAEFEGRRATGTSLAAIGFTAVFGAIAFGILGDVEWVQAAKVGLPAMAGTLAGISLQRRVSSRVLVGLFGCFLGVVAIRLLLE